jgi:hypothetical protein
MTEDEFLGKVEWEGGVLDALEYGLRASMLKDQNSKLASRWRALEAEWRRLQNFLGPVEQYFDNWQEDDENAEEEDYAA